VYLDDNINGRILLENNPTQNDIFSTTTGFLAYKTLRFVGSGFILRDGNSSTDVFTLMSGAATFTSTVTASAATAPEHVVIKSQIDQIFVVEKSTNFTLTDADIAKPFVITASCTMTIPNGLMAGFNATFVTLAGVTLTVALGGSVVLFNNAGTTMLEKSSFTLQARTAANNYITAGAL
jgi:hypothetical protein